MSSLTRGSRLSIKYDIRKKREILLPNAGKYLFSIVIIFLVIVNIISIEDNSFPRYFELPLYLNFFPFTENKYHFVTLNLLGHNLDHVK